MTALFVLFFVFAGAASGQEMTKDQWQQEWTTYTARVGDLQRQVSTLDTEINTLKSQSVALDADLKNCEDEVITTLGTTRDEFDAFERELAQMEKRVAELQAMSDAQVMGFRDELTTMDNRLAEMGVSRTGMLPRFKTRIDGLRGKIAGLLKSADREKTYTVGTWSRDRDCLWNIAKKRDVYANAWLWPKIWQGNRDKIKDPDVIQPRWVLRIPAGNELTRDEKSAANRYYRSKSAASSPDGTQ